MNYKSRRQATAFLRENGLPCGDTFLAQEASAGTGPEYQYCGRYPLYREDALKAWLEARLSAPVRSPSEKTIALLNALPDDEQQLSPLTHSARPGRRKRGRPTSAPTATGTLQERA
jgi:hypothetical protein